MKDWILKWIVYLADLSSSNQESLSPKTEFLNDDSPNTELINKYLKDIGNRTDTETKISFRMARHSFADLARSKGWSIYDISKALAHNNFKITERCQKKWAVKDWILKLKLSLNK